MRIQIKSRFDDRILYECAAESMLVALQQAVKTGANLYGKEIVSVVQFGGIGSERRSSTAIVLVDGSVDVRCGCFCGSLGEFAAQIERTHANNSRCLAEYRAAVEFVQKCAEAALDAMPKAEKSA